MSIQVPPKAPIQVFDSSLNFLAEVDTYESLSHQRGWNGPGAFSIKIHWTITDDTGLIQYASFFQVGGYITIGNDGTKCGLITSIDKPIDSGGKQSQDVTISGYEPTIIFNRRLFSVPANQDVYSISANAETVIKTAISDQAGPTATNTKRAFPLLSIATNQNRGATYLLSVSQTELLAELTKCSIATKLGWFITLDRANKLLVLDCALGNNRVAGQNPQAVFSNDYDTLQSADLVHTDEQYKNLATVASKGQGQLRTIQDVYTSPEPSGFSRYEIFVNANSIAVGDTANLTLQGQQTLGQYQYQNTLTGSNLAKSPLVYQTDYNLGDFVTLKAYDYSQNVQITMIQEEWANLSYIITPTFDKAPSDIGTQVAVSSKNQSQVISNLGSPISITNSNGTAVQYPDGSMVCSGTVSFGLTGNTAFGNLFLAAGTVFSITFPATFYSVIGVIGMPLNDVSGSCCMFQASLTTSGATVGVVRAGNASSAGTFTWQAIGRWRA